MLIATLRHWFVGVVALLLGAPAGAAPIDSIRLSSGEVLHVTIVEVTDQSVRFVHPVLGEITLPRASVEILPAAEPAPVAATMAATTEPQSPPASQPASSPAAQPAIESQPASAPEIPASQPESPPKEWTFRLVLGVGAASGNTDNASFNTIFNARRDNPRARTDFDASYFFAENDGVTTENRFSTGLRHDWLNPGSEWFWFANARFDYDEFNSWRERLTGHLGMGYHLITPPKLRVDLLAGMGANKEWGSEDEGVRPEALLGVEGAYAFNDKNTITFSSTYYPDVSDFQIFRWTNSLAWSWIVDKKTDLALTAGVLHEYQSQVDPGQEKNDVRVYAGLQLDF